MYTELGFGTKNPNINLYSGITIQGYFKLYNSYISKTLITL